MNGEVQEERWCLKWIHVYLASTRRKMDHQTEKHFSRVREFQEGLEGDREFHFWGCSGVLECIKAYIFFHHVSKETSG